MTQSSATILSQFQEHVDEYKCWFARQPRQHLVTTLMLGFFTVMVLYWGIYLAGWIVVGLISWLFTSDTPPAPEPPDEPGPLSIAIEQSFHYLGTIAQHWSSAHAFGGVDSAVVPLLWLIIGGVLLLFSQSLIGVPLFAVWGMATVWAVYDASGGNPVPAALAAGGIAIAWVGWWFLAATLRGLFTD